LFIEADTDADLTSFNSGTGGSQGNCGGNETNFDRTIHLDNSIKKKIKTHEKTKDKIQGSE
jgi:hypothetical protein